MCLAPALRIFDDVDIMLVSIEAREAAQDSRKPSLQSGKMHLGGGCKISTDVSVSSARQDQIEHVCT